MGCGRVPWQPLLGAQHDERDALLPLQQRCSISSEKPAGRRGAGVAV